MKLFKREKYLKKIRKFYDSDDIIKVITGVRRCGKSSLMTTIVNELLEKGVDSTNIIYIDLDTREYRKVKEADQLEKIIDGRSSGVKGLKYLFVDEVQNVKGFEEVLNGYRTEGNYSIFITGSNSYLLSGELITKLTGRYLEFEMFTLSFEEYVNMKKFYNKSVSSNTIEELSKYILEGGFPRAIQLDDIADKRTYTQGIVKEIFEKDIKRRVKVKDRDSFEAVRNFVINNFSSPITSNGITEALRKNGTNITRITVDRYIRALVDAKIIYECNRFDMKSKKVLKKEKKYYLADLSFYYSLNTDNQLNYGPCLENIVYTYVMSQDYSVSVGRIGKLECDFILRSKSQDYSYVQVSYTIMANKETEDREYKPLEQIKDNYPKYVVTTDYLIQKRSGIKHVNIINFMLDGQMF